MVVETRSAKGEAPKPAMGTYNTDEYYARTGEVDLAVGQEPDAGTVDNPEDKDFQPRPEDDRAATAEAQAEVTDVDTGDARGELEDLKRSGDTGQEEVDEAGEPVPVVEGAEDEPEETIIPGADLTT